MIILIENQLLTHLFIALSVPKNGIYLFFVTTHEKEIEFCILDMFCIFSKITFGLNIYFSVISITERVSMFGLT